jgi:hypothetical protein
VPTEGEVTLVLTDADGRSTDREVAASALSRRDGELLVETDDHGEVSLLHANGEFYGSI